MLQKLFVGGLGGLIFVSGLYLYFRWHRNSKGRALVGIALIMLGLAVASLIGRIK